MQNTDRAPGFFSVASWPLCVSRDLERRPPAGGRAQGGVPVLAHQVAARGWSEQSCLPTRSPDCHRTLASTTDRPRLSPPPLPPAFRPQHQPLSGLRAAPARPPELADVIATQCTRHQAPRIRCLSLFGEGPGARPTAAPSHRAGLILFWDWRATAYLTHAYQNEYHSHTRREREFSPRVHDCPFVHCLT